MTNLINRHVEIYHEDYDDIDRYFDFLYKFYKNINEYIYDKAYGILDNNNFVSFFDLCVNHMNHVIVDDMILSHDIEQLRHDFGCQTILNNNYVDYDEYIEPPLVDETESITNSKRR